MLTDTDTPLTAMKRFLAKEWDKVKTIKRGGQVRLVPLQLDTAETRYTREPADTCTPEQLGTFDGQFFLFRHRSQLLLDDCQLTVSRAGAFTIIPLAAIRDLSIGHYPRIMHPVGLDFISATYDENGETKRLFISPYESWYGTSLHPMHRAGDRYYWRPQR